MKRKKEKLKNYEKPNACIDYSQTIDDVYENLEDCNPIKKGKVLIVLDDMIAQMKVTNY